MLMLSVKVISREEEACGRRVKLGAAATFVQAEGVDEEQVEVEVDGDRMK